MVKLHLIPLRESPWEIRSWWKMSFDRLWARRSTLEQVKQFDGLKALNWGLHSIRCSCFLLLAYHLRSMSKNKGLQLGSIMQSKHSGNNEEICWIGRHYQNSQKPLLYGPIWSGIWWKRKTEEKSKSPSCNIFPHFITAAPWGRETDWVKRTRGV